MEYIAHLNEEHIQTIRDHLYGTAELAGGFAERFGKADWGYCCGMLHDIGKYSLAFQEKIKNNSVNGWIILQREQRCVLKKAVCTDL